MGNNNNWLKAFSEEYKRVHLKGTKRQLIKALKKYIKSKRKGRKMTTKLQKKYLAKFDALRNY